MNALLKRSIRVPKRLYRVAYAHHALRRAHTVLGIETSCDDTGVALVDYENRRVVEEMVSSQFHTHAPWKGVVPAMAARDHQVNLPKVLTQVLQRAQEKDSKLKIDAVAATAGPGLALCLKTGFLTGKMVARYLNVPFIPVHHMAAHALVCRLDDPTISYPFLTLLVSGGHTMIVLVKGFGDYQVIGSTLDDSIGEAIDKVGRVLRVGLHQDKLISDVGKESSKDPPHSAHSERQTDNKFGSFFPTFSANLPDTGDPPVTTHYGVLLEKLASFGDPFSFDIKVPLDGETPSSSRKKEQRKKRQASKLKGKGEDSPALEGIHHDIQFSLSGLKTKLLQLSTSTCDPTDFNSAANLAASFQRVATKHLTQQLQKAMKYCIYEKELPLSRVVVAGGVAANSYIREAIKEKANSLQLNVSFPPLRYCTDNGTMIAWSGAEMVLNRQKTQEAMPHAYNSDFSSRWPLGDPAPQRHEDHSSEVAMLREEESYRDALRLLDAML